MELAAAVSGLGNVPKDTVAAKKFAEANVGGVDLAEVAVEGVEPVCEAGRIEMPAAKRRAAVSFRAFLCAIYSPVSASLESSLSSISSRYSVHRVVSISCSALAA